MITFKAPLRCFSINATLMKQVFSFLFLSLFFVACQKESDVAEKPLAEQNITDATYGTDPGQRMDIYLPEGSEARR